MTCAHFFVTFAEKIGIIQNVPETIQSQRKHIVNSYFLFMVFGSAFDVEPLKQKQKNGKFSISGFDTCEINIKS